MKLLAYTAGVILFGVAWIAGLIAASRVLMWIGTELFVRN